MLSISKSMFKYCTLLVRNKKAVDANNGMITIFCFLPKTNSNTVVAKHEQFLLCIEK